MPRHRRLGSSCRPPWSSVYLAGRRERHQHQFRCKPDISTRKALSSPRMGPKAIPAVSMAVYRALLQLGFVLMIKARCTCSKSAASSHPKVVLFVRTRLILLRRSIRNIQCELGNSEVAVIAIQDAARARPSFDDLIGGGEDCSRYRQAEGLRGLEVQRQIEFAGRFHRHG